jgi:hypothetical protein
MGGRDHVVLVVCFSSQELVLCSRFKVVCCGTVMFSSVVMNFVFVCGCHFNLDIWSEAIWKIPERLRKRALARFVATPYR